MKKILTLMLLANLIFVICGCSKIDTGDTSDHQNPLYNTACKSNEILYTTKYGYAITLNEENGFGGKLRSNTYENGVGRLAFDDTITAIPNEAFKDCNTITNIKLPNSVTKIGNLAFHNCNSLTNIIIPNSVTAIGVSAFADCYCLTNIIIPNRVTTIEMSIFSGCSSLTSVTIPDNVTSIGYDAFYECSSLTSVTIGNGVTNIEKSAFYCCKNLEAFYGKFASADNRCIVVDGVLLSFAPSGLTAYKIPDNVTTIGYYAFYKCANLTSVTISDSVKEIGAFSYCSGLSAFYGKFASADNRCLIVDGALESFAPSGLTKYTIPNSVTSIGDYAFEGCSNLKNITIPNSVTSIGGEAFRNCSSLTSITIPNNVTSIGNFAFLDCSSLTSVYCKPTNPPTGGIYMFMGYKNDSFYSLDCYIYVPKNSVSRYKSKQNWSNYADDIVGYDF